MTCPAYPYPHICSNMCHWKLASDKQEAEAKKYLELLDQIFSSLYQEERDQYLAAAEIELRNCEHTGNRLGAWGEYCDFCGARDKNPMNDGCLDRAEEFTLDQRTTQRILNLAKRRALENSQGRKAVHL